MASILCLQYIGPAVIMTRVMITVGLVTGHWIEAIQKKKKKKPIKMIKLLNVQKEHNMP